MKKQNENSTPDTSAIGVNGGSVPRAVATGDLSDGVGAATVTNVRGTDFESEALTHLRSENEQLKTTIRLSAAHRQITGELLKAGARSPELLFDAIKGELKFTADGKLENPKGLIDSVTARFPEQFGFGQPASIDAGAGRASGNTLTREALAKMKPAEIAALDWADVRRILAGS